MRNYIKCCYLGMLKYQRFFEDTDELDTKNALEAAEREWRSLWPMNVPVPPKRFRTRPVACTVDKDGEVKRSACHSVPMLAVHRRPEMKGPLRDLPMIGESVEEALYKAGPVWLPRPEAVA